jgi:hypothetical protein
MTADPIDQPLGDPPAQYDVGDEVTIIIRGRVHSEYEAWVPGGVETMLEVRFHGGLYLHVPQESGDVEILATDERSEIDAAHSAGKALHFTPGTGRRSNIDVAKLVAQLRARGWRYFPPAM